MEEILEHYVIARFNRTTIELKFDWYIKKQANSTGFNRTTIELKFHITFYKIISVRVLIELL